MTVATDFTRDGQRPGLSIFVKTDAPSTVLSVSPQVWVGGRGDPGLVAVRVSPGAPSSEPSAVFRIWLEEDPDERWAPGWGLGLDTTPLRVTVVEPMAQPAPCERLELTGKSRRGRRRGWNPGRPHLRGDCRRFPLGRGHAALGPSGDVAHSPFPVTGCPTQISTPNRTGLESPTAPIRRPSSSASVSGKQGLASSRRCHSAGSTSSTFAPKRRAATR